MRLSITSIAKCQKKNKKNWEIDTISGNLKYLEKKCPTVTLPTTNPRQIGIFSQPRPRGERPATNRLSYEAVVGIPLSLHGLF